MSDTALEALPRTAADQPAGGVVCCPTDLSLTAASARIPWLRLIIGALVAAQTMMLGMTINLTTPDDRTTLLLLQGGMLAATLLVMALLGLPLAIEALTQLRQRRLTMELLFLAGIAASLGISLWSAIGGSGPVYFEVVNVLLVIYAAGHAITSHSRSRALAATQRMLRDVAQARMADGQMREVTLIGKGDRVRVMPGELIPVDGVVIAGQSLVRTTAFTGEWQSLTCGEGDAVLAGSACEDGTLVVEANAAGLDRRIDKLANLIASACQSTSPMQRLADRFVRVFLPAVTLVATATLLYWGLVQHNWPAAIFNALAVILVACPCAAGLAVPLTTWTTISRLAEKGLLLKSADALQRLAMTQAVIFDKTGTLADERLELRELETAPDPQQRQRTLSLLAAVERNSEHPVARALRNLPGAGAGAKPIDGVEVRAVRILPGRGIEADVVLEGRASITRLIRREDTELLTIDASVDGTWIATVSFAEALRTSSTKAVERLTGMGLPVEVMTGDSSGRTTADLAKVSSGKTPEQKHLAARAATSNVLFVGDGVNDAAAMAASHSSIALASGSQIAIETADATLHGGDLAVIPDAILLARRAMATIRSNFAWAVGYNVVGMALAVSGLLHPVAAAVLMMLSSAVVAWRGFNLSAAAPATAAPAAAMPSSQISEVRTLPAWLYSALHLVGMLGQGAILILLAQLSLGAGLAVLAMCAAAALLTIRFRAKLPEWADMTIAMLSIGGLGMNLGWWMDLHFSPAIQNGMVMACCMVRKTMEATGAESSSHWMYWLMLIGGVPAMYILRRGRERGAIYFNWRSWCCTGMLLLGVPGMCFGMWSGAQLAMRLENLPGQLQVVVAYVLMMAGMCAGMLVPHALELAWWPLRQPKA